MAYILGAFYLGYMLIGQKGFSKMHVIKRGACSHLDLHWWNDIKYSGYIYVAVLIIPILFLMKPFKLAFFVSAFILITLYISVLFYSCSGPSLWCFFAVSGSLATYLFDKYYVKK